MVLYRCQIKTVFLIEEDDGMMFSKYAGRCNVIDFVTVSMG